MTTSRAATEYRYEKLTWPEINDAVDLGKVCIVPCGAVEQHGPHLPLDVDCVCPRGVALHAAQPESELAGRLAVGAVVVADVAQRGGVLAGRTVRRVEPAFEGRPAGRQEVRRRPLGRLPVIYR